MKRFTLQNQAVPQQMARQQQEVNLQTPPNSTGAVIDSNLIGSNVRIIQAIGDATVEAQVATVDTAKQLNVTDQPSVTWGVVSTPAAAAQATASKAAGGGTVKHVATSISFSAAQDGTHAITLVQVNLRDGATGAGTILWSMSIIKPTTDTGLTAVTISGLKLVGSANTAMTLEFSANGVTGAVQSVSLTGYDLPA